MTLAPKRPLASSLAYQCKPGGGERVDCSQSRYTYTAVARLTLNSGHLDFEMY